MTAPVVTSVESAAFLKQLALSTLPLSKEERLHLLNLSEHFKGQKKKLNWQEGLHAAIMFLRRDHATQAEGLQRIMVNGFFMNRSELAQFLQCSLSTSSFSSQQALLYTYRSQTPYPITYGLSPISEPVSSLHRHSISMPKPHVPKE